MAGVTDKVATAPKPRPLRPAAFVLPVLAFAGHAAWLASQREEVVERFNATGGADMGLWVGVPLAAAAAYVVAVWLGTRAWGAEGVAAWDPKEAMLAYNGYLCLLSAWMCWSLVSESAALGSLGWATHVDGARGGGLAYALWVNYHSKFLEYCDTAFMVVRRKFDQISLLHVSHHAEMGVIMWMLLAYSPGGNSYFGPALNSAVHTLMYAYYALTAAGFKPAWKMAMTLGQLAQFVAVMAQAVWCLVHWDAYWPSTLSLVSLGLMVQMLWMFGDFFATTFCGKGKGKAKRAAGGGAGGEGASERKAE